MLRLSYLMPNAVYAFTFGDALLRLGTSDMFFTTRANAVRAAEKQGLAVDAQGNVTTAQPARKRKYTVHPANESGCLLPEAAK